MTIRNQFPNEPVAFGLFTYYVTPYCDGKVCVTTSSVQPAIILIYNRRRLEELIPSAYGAVKMIYEKALICLEE